MGFSGKVRRMTIGSGDPGEVRKPTAVPSTPGVPADDARRFDLYRIYRGQVEHEDNLLGSRTSVFVTSQSFLFSAYAIIANTAQARAFDMPIDPKHVLLILIPSVAITTSVLFIPAIISGVVSLQRLRRQYRQATGHPANACCHDLPPIQSTRGTRVAGTVASALLPPLFLGVWAYLLLARLF
jgi:hypothetical protein